MRALAEQVRRFAQPTRTCSSPARRAPARMRSRASCTRGARAPGVRSSRSTAPALPSRSSIRSSSATNAARSPTRCRPRRALRAGRGTGSVYLDAVTELPIEAQGKLLRIVEDKRVERLGGHTSVGRRADRRFGRRGHRGRRARRRVPRRPVSPPARAADRRSAAAGPSGGRAAAGDDISKRAAAARRERRASRATRRPRCATTPGRATSASFAMRSSARSTPPRAAPIGLDPSSGEILEAPALEIDRPLARRPTLDEVERRYIAATLRGPRQSDRGRAAARHQPESAVGKAETFTGAYRAMATDAE